ncbi:NUDIX domain-containing protein [Sanguibacter gelidistatuariae]|uniref:NUDIX domain-containing protein n=1 Tax=Sanguibacter gelidistatuariae TaxID=1814289 RepID=A0A1G6RJG7_9MICO|nr:CoA pyrophosphatase [Sanguibacter gelidistatuariae]SDD04789.1 NUDIX domain-containing protein [Sanguibacter gelidistatuariae]
MTESVRAQLDRLVRSGLVWDRALSHTDAQARAAAVLVLFGDIGPAAGALGTPGRTAGGGAPAVDLLFVERAASLNHHPGQIAFPGGRIDPEDSGPVAAALREGAEETGLDPAGVDVVGVLGDLPLPVSNHVVTPVLAWWDVPCAVAAMDPAESAAVFRVPVATLLDPANRGTAVIHRGTRVFDSPAFAVEDRIVWGFTGLVLDGLFDALGWTQPWEPRPIDVPA